MSSPILRLGLAATAIAASSGVLGCGGSERAPAAATAGDASETSLTLPPGFRATVFADSLGQARHITSRPSGEVYLNTWRNPYDTTRRVPPGGFLVALRDTDGDGKADQVQRFGAESGNGGTGIAFFQDALAIILGN
jgi:hypothetical protein